MIWNNKPINFTFHALKELEESGKNADIILEILEKGMHGKESKEKTIVKLKTDKKYELVFIEREEDVLIIHLRA